MKNNKFSKFTALNTQQLSEVKGKGPGCIPNETDPCAVDPGLGIGG